MGQLRYNAETKRYEMNGWGLHCGHCFEVLIYDEESESVKWVPTRIESNDFRGWYLVGLEDYQIGGLFAR